MISSQLIYKTTLPRCLAVLRSFASKVKKEIRSNQAADHQKVSLTLAKVKFSGSISEVQFPDIPNSITETKWLDLNTMAGKVSIKKARSQVQDLTQRLKQEQI